MGEVVNLMSVDTQKLQDAAQFLQYIWTSPIIIVLAMVLLWQNLGVASLAGFGFLVILLPANSALLAAKIRQYQVLSRDPLLW